MDVKLSTVVSWTIWNDIQTVWCIVNMVDASNSRYLLCQGTDRKDPQPGYRQFEDHYAFWLAGVLQGGALYLLLEMFTGFH